ncbi:tetraspanin-6 [Solea senegalensis]|uniref:Tetraspanin-6 n=1 Tax=Solea senegalensis TaxID=28829 RepID=A0AAV6R0M5_SOLSE|nr:tetraspanin-7-like [Solea senegalensis]KAG7499094.1 tetraspanin-6 [Solea senegalensis]
MLLPSRRFHTCLRNFLLCSNVLFCIVGVILLEVGVWGKLILDAYFYLEPEENTNATYVLIGTGITTVIFGLLGCFAVFRGTPWMLKLYAFFFTMVFLSGFVAGVSGFIFKHEVKAIFGAAFENAVKSYSSSDSSDTAVDAIQRTLHCCGVRSYSDWSDTAYYKENGLPASCCKDNSDCSPETLKDLDNAESEVYKLGCFEMITNALEANLEVIAAIAFKIASLHLIGILLACCLSQQPA